MWAPPRRITVATFPATLQGPRRFLVRLRPQGLRDNRRYDRLAEGVLGIRAIRTRIADTSVVHHPTKTPVQPASEWREWR